MAVVMIYKCGWCEKRNEEIIPSLVYCGHLGKIIQTHYHYKCRHCKGLNLIVKDETTAKGVVIPVKEDAEFHLVKEGEPDG